MEEESAKIREDASKEEVLRLVEKLQQYDNNLGYELEYTVVKEKLNEVITKLAIYGESAIECLHALIEHEETWSSLFALEILKEIKSEKSILPLIHYIKNSDDSDYYESCEEAMYALIAIGEPAIKPLLYEIKSNFRNKEYFSYLISAFTGIKHEEVYNFMIEILQDYINNNEKYEDWLEIDEFTYDFSVQGRKEVLPLLKKLLAMEHLSEFQQKEIESTIEVIEDPEEFEKEMDETAKNIGKYLHLKKEDVNRVELLNEALGYEEKKDYENALDCLARILAVYPESYVARYVHARINRKLGKPEVMGILKALEEAKKQKASSEVREGIAREKEMIIKLYQENSMVPDKEIVLHFRCNNCSKKQNLNPGSIWEVEHNTHLFEKEIMCRHCFSHDLELTEDGKRRILQQNMRMLAGKATGILHTGKKVMVENKAMSYKKSYSYLLQRIREEPANGELYLRAGNSARRANKYEDAIWHYKKSIELNPKLIASYVNLVEIFQYRNDYYKINAAKEDAIFYLKKIRQVYDSRDYNITTLRNPNETILFIRNAEADFGLAAKGMVTKKITEEEIEQTIRQHATLDINKISSNIKRKITENEDDARQLLVQNKGVTVFQSYQVFEKGSNETKSVQAAFIMPVEKDKLCICGSHRYLQDCCMRYVKQKKPFAANIDYAYYSLAEEHEKELIISMSYPELINGFKDDPRFYCDEETDKNALFLYYGNFFLTEKDLGAIIFGTIKIKNKGKDNTSITINALSKNRFDALHEAVKEHLD